MNPLLSRLQPYPFERVKALFKGVTPNADFSAISLGIGEPKHPTPALICDTLKASLGGLAQYPATTGELALRESMSRWVERRYSVQVDASTQVLPVNGSREALFSFAQVAIDSTQKNAEGQGPLVLSPNPFYQIYEGAALLAGADIAFVNSDPACQFGPDWNAVDAATWARVQLVYVCSPGNPTGSVLTLDEWTAPPPAIDVG